MSAADPVPERDACRYQSCYCEENVWWLAEAMPDGFVLVVSNRDKTVPVWLQRASPSAEEPVVWDYHVIFVLPGRAGVLDLDTRLQPWPAPALDYARLSFQPHIELPPALEPMFRAVPAAEFVRRFSSDRAHMRGADGEWQMPPPEWPPRLDGDVSLDSFRAFPESGAPGEVLESREALLAWLGSDAS